MEQSSPSQKPFYKKYLTYYPILSRLAFVIVVLWLGAIFLGSDNTILKGNALAYWTNIATEILGVLVTIVVINHIIVTREQEKLQKRLIRQAGSPSQTIATEAIAQLREEGWLTGEKGLLQGASLRGTNLSGADLTGANLRGAKLYQANLSSAILEYADLRETDLRDTDLSHARLYKVNCEGASLENADFTEAVVWEANFKRTNLKEANLTRASFPVTDFTGANMECTILDGCNLKATVIRNVNIVGASFKGATLVRATVDNLSIGFTTVMLPDNRAYFTILPDGRAIALDENIEQRITELRQSGVYVPDMEFVVYEDINWEQFINSNHPDYRTWQFDWMKEQFQQNG
jgi:hypothetical protein